MADSLALGQNVPKSPEGPVLEPSGLFLMDGIAGLRSLPEHSVDMLLTDPPYELRPAPEVSGLLWEGRPRPIAEQMKEAARLAGERQAPSAPKRDAPDRGGR